MLKTLKKAGLVPALVVTAVLAAAMIVPASANLLGVVISTPGCGYGYPAAGAPTVTDVDPSAGPPGGGTTVTITGTNFCQVLSVHFGANAATSVVNVSRTQITATSPAGSAGSTVDVTVTTVVSTSATNANDKFFYVVDRGVACTTLQYFLSNSDGVTWKTMDGANLSLGFTPAADGFAEFGVNSDLWTEKSGFNQDIGVTVLGGTTPKYPTSAGQPEGWKESGGFAGTRSPNAAFVNLVIPVAGSTSYTIKLVWKANKPDSAGIFAAAGPRAPFSPTGLTIEFSTAQPMDVVSNQQYSLKGSDGKQ